MYDSVLNTVKSMLGVEESYEAFDVELITHINSALFVAYNIGVQLVKNYTIDGPNVTWSEICPDVNLIPLLKSYIGLKVRLLFDPPTTGVLHEAMERQVTEFEWRLYVESDPANNTEEGGSTDVDD